MTACCRPAALLCIVLSLATVRAEASASVQDLIREAAARDLGRDPVWLKLLHYGGGDRSEVLSQEFFLSPHGASDPSAELSATLEAYYLPWEEADSEQHARCRFPARYYWLAQQLPQLTFVLREPRCRHLDRWALFDRVRSISVLLVSGYFGNPASTFGHALLKLNTDADDDEAGLFDVGLNFGALVPENEATLVYVVRGLFGGYQAGFSDKYFYTQDLVYSRTELRDIWNYRLVLSDSARTLLILHIWEIIGKKFDYYFLTKNCAYRLAELLELASGERFLDRANVWYVPTELFHRLVDIDKRRGATGSVPLVESVGFIPSGRRTLQKTFERLNIGELTAANEIISNGVESLPGTLAVFEADRQGEILDALLAYYQYRTIAEQPMPSKELRTAKDRVLLERLRLPARAEAASRPQILRSPAEGSRPMLTSVGIARQQNSDAYGRVRFAAFSQEFVGNHSAEGDELVVFDLAVGIDQRSSVFFDQLDFIRVRKLNTMRGTLPGESGLSWELDIAARRVEHDGQLRTDALVRFGSGLAWKWGPAVTFYTMTDVAAHSLSPEARARPHVGVLIAAERWRTAMQLGMENTDGAKNWRDVWSGKVQYQISTNQALRIELTNETAMREAVSLIWHW